LRGRIQIVEARFVGEEETIEDTAPYWDGSA